VDAATHDGPLLICIDDAHWTDGATAAVWATSIGRRYWFSKVASRISANGSYNHEPS
jgi:hypothetical protein